MRATDVCRAVRPALSRQRQDRRQGGFAIPTPRVDRCWQRIHETAKSVNPKCIIWLSCFDLRHPQVVGSKMFQEVDWLMNENPDPTSLAAVRKEAGPHTKIMQCLCGWGDKHDPRRVVGNPKYDDVGFYGFAAANPPRRSFQGTSGSSRDGAMPAISKFSATYFTTRCRNKREPKQVSWSTINIGGESPIFPHVPIARAASAHSRPLAPFSPG